MKFLHWVASVKGNYHHHHNHHHNHHVCSAGVQGDVQGGKFKVQWVKISKMIGTIKIVDTNESFSTLEGTSMQTRLVQQYLVLPPVGEFTYARFPMLTSHPLINASARPMAASPRSPSPPQGLLLQYFKSDINILII